MMNDHKFNMQAQGAQGPVQAGHIENLTQQHITIRQGANNLDPKALQQLYLQYLAAATNILPWASVNPDHADPGRGESLGLADVYTSLDTTELERPETEDQVREHLARQKEIRRLSAQEMINQRSKLVLLGDPGSGKSTFVNYLTHILARAGLAQDSPAPSHADVWLARLQTTGPWQHGFLLPVRIILRDFAEKISFSKESCGAGPIFRYLKEMLQESADLGDYWNILRDRLSDPETPCLMLLDGLDEAPAARRQEVVGMIDAFAKQYPHHRYLVTCRIYAYVGKEYQLTGFHQATLTPFGPEQIENFIDAWYHELALRGRFTEKEAGLRAQRLKLAALRPDLRGLAERPLLITVMALLHTFRGQLPDDRVELYQWTVDLLLRRWESRFSNEKGLLEILNIPGLKMNDLEAGLYDVAFYAHSAQAGKGEAADIGEAALRERLAPYLDNDWNKAGEFVKYVQERAGLLIRHKPQAYTFPHRTFQEFLAACHLLGLKDYPTEAARRAKQEPDRWRMVFILSTGYAARTHRLGQAAAAVNALCPEAVRETRQANARDFRLAGMAAEALIETGLLAVARDTVGKAVLKRVQYWLLAAMQADQILDPPERVACGNLLARLGDPRFDARKKFLPQEKNLGFIRIPAGEFFMGSDNRLDPDAGDDELPQHRVWLPEYWINRYPVTVAQYRAFVADTGQAVAETWEEDNKFDNHPVVKVTWHEAVAYCHWLTQKLNKPGWLVRLPTEAEWEKAARGADGRLYPWGNDPIDPNRANYGGIQGKGIQTTSPVGCFPGGQNPLGVLDMAGNVFEWCLDDKREYTADSVTNPVGSLVGAARVVRGGSWASHARYCRSAYRNRDVPGNRYFILGLRLVLAPPGQQAEQGQ